MFGGGGGQAAAIPPRPSKQMPQEIEIKVSRADEAAEKVLRLLEPFETLDQAVPDRIKLQVEQGCDHWLASFSLVARKKTSSRVASPACSENLRVISSMVPSMIFRPFFR